MQEKQKYLKLSKMNFSKYSKLTLPRNKYKNYKIRLNRFVTCKIQNTEKFDIGMKQKTKIKIVQAIAQKLTLEDKYSRFQKLSVWASYFLQICIFQICLIVSIVEPKLHISDTISKYSSISLTLFLLRITLAIFYLATKSLYIVPLIKLIQIANIYLLRTGFCSVALIFQFIAEMYYTSRKEKRQINFDSRLQNKYFGTKIFALYILLFATFLTDNLEIHKNPSAVFFTAIIFYACACLDSIYSYRVRQILRNMAICPILMAIYFMCIPLVPVFNTFGLAAHSLLSSSILLAIMFYAVTSSYPYHHDILYKKILNLQSRDKLLYLWSLIYFSEAPTPNALLCFIKTHQSKCFNSLCPLNFNHQSSALSKLGGPSHSMSSQSIHKAIKIYLDKALDRFASESDQIRRLFIYYRKEDDPKIVHLLKQDDVYEKIEEHRISKNLSRYNDISLEYEQMKDIQAETQTKAKLYLNHYDYFLSYLNKESIKMETSEDIIKELLKLKHYFLSFKPNTAPIVQEQKHSQNSQKRNSALKDSKGYQKIDEQAIPIKKMTLKTTILVNFMRRVYFNMPSLQKQQLTAKRLTYISQDYEQSPILVISAESYNLGKIINWNTMATKTLMYSTKQLKSKFVNDLLPKCMHKVHEKIFMKASLAIQITDVCKSLPAYVFCFTKSSHTQIFDLHIQGTNSISGNKWICELRHKFQNQAIMVVDQHKKIVGVNKNAINFGIPFNVAGQTMNEELFNMLIQKKQNKITISTDIQPYNNFKMETETQWELICQSLRYQELPLFYIFLIQKTDQIQKNMLSRLSKHKQSQEIDIPMPENGFEFNFDPLNLKFTNAYIPAHQEADLALIWKQNQSIDENSHFQNNGFVRKIKNYGENIHQMIYFDNKLQFKQNYEQITEFQTHPNNILNGKMSNTKTQININKQNFIDNVDKIRSKIPFFFYQLVILSMICGLICFITLSLRFVQFKSLYGTVQQKEFVQIQMVNRKNLIDNIGSLSVYFSKKQAFPSIWDNYRKNDWTFQQLFVQIQYTNSKINNLNNQMGMLVNKAYTINGKKRSLASYFQSLSIQASAQSTGQLNLTRFITQIVDQITLVQLNIQQDVKGYYKNIQKNYRTNIYIIDAVQCCIVILVVFILHIVLRKAYFERVNLFKSLSVIEQQEISRIQKNLNEHREQIKNNELDTFTEDDYTQPLESQNIPHTKKMLYSYSKSSFAILYIFATIMIATSGIFFSMSQIYYSKASQIQLVEPFIGIIGEQRNSMSKMYLNLIADTKNSIQISADIMKNIGMFQINKKGVIESLIQKRFSEKYIQFYNKIWFSPCAVLNVKAGCESLFSGILSDNLDYNYVYILTEVENIVDYRAQRVSSLLAANPQFQKDITTEIETSYKKINFLLFDFMTKLHSQFNMQTSSEIMYLYNQISNANILTYVIILVVCILYTIIVLGLVYRIRNVSNQSIEMITTVIPYHILMRNEYFIQWYKRKFKNVY